MTTIPNIGQENMQAESKMKFSVFNKTCSFERDAFQNPGIY